MRHIYLQLTLAILFCMVDSKAFAYDIAVENEDGVTLYYNYINDGTELEVTYKYYYDSYKIYQGVDDPEVNIPDKVTYMNRERTVSKIGNYAFYVSHYSNSPDILKTITIPNSVKSIGDYAFCGCRNLTFINIPNNVTSIGDYAFSECYKLASIDLPNSVTTIGDYIFNNCSNLKSVVIGDGLNNLPQNTFKSCSELKSITIGDGLISIPYRAFRDLSKLQSITIGSGVKSIEDEAFYNCKSLRSVYIHDLAAWCNIDFGSLSSQPTMSLDSHYSNPLVYAHNLYLNNHVITNLVIPETVTKIKKYTFLGCSTMASVTIPTSVTSIGIGAFADCSGLKSIIFPNTVDSIGSSAFYGCKSLNTVHISDLEAWCKIGFTAATPAFYNAWNYEYTSNPLTYAHNLYLNDKKIIDLVIPESVTSLKGGVFHSCSVKNVTIPNCVTNIGEFAFGDCSNMNSVTIPNSVKSIKRRAFEGCNQLYTIISLIENPFELNTDAFDNDHYMNSSLYVPVGAIDKYKSTEGWKKFVWMEEGIPTGIQEKKVSNDEKTWYSLNGMKLESAKKGINIIRHANGKTSKVLIK